MTKSDLIDVVADRAELTKRQVGQIVERIFGEIEAALKKGDRVALTPFGSFVVRSRKAREGRNPKTGEKIDIPARKVPAFVAGKSLKDSVSGLRSNKKGQPPLESNRPRFFGLWRSLVSALDWGSRGRRFESCQPDHANRYYTTALFSAITLGARELRASPVNQARPGITATPCKQLRSHWSMRALRRRKWFHTACRRCRRQVFRAGPRRRFRL